MSDYTKLKAEGLKDLLRARGLFISGNKAALRARLEADDRQKVADRQELDTKMEHVLMRAGLKVNAAAAGGIPTSIPSFTFYFA